MALGQAGEHFQDTVMFERVTGPMLSRGSLPFRSRLGERLKLGRRVVVPGNLLLLILVSH